MGVQQQPPLVSKTRAPKPVSEARRIRKPLMERKRRERINTSLNDLARLLTEAHLVNAEAPGKQTKLEKADILELTVKHLKDLKTQQVPDGGDDKQPEETAKGPPAATRRASPGVWAWWSRLSEGKTVEVSTSPVPPQCPDTPSTPTSDQCPSASPVPPPPCPPTSPPHPPTVRLPPFLCPPRVRHIAPSPTHCPPTSVPVSTPCPPTSPPHPPTVRLPPFCVHPCHCPTSHPLSAYLRSCVHPVSAPPLCLFPPSVPTTTTHTHHGDTLSTRLYHTHTQQLPALNVHIHPVSIYIHAHSTPPAHIHPVLTHPTTSHTQQLP
ncbi:deadpan-like 7 [Homarus americanus]|uniref:Deadpan-like 7 n=1 Tax=Homarus americanus TaxID=6706 RepID=A0A8J5MXK5_HOMAM|nr:deadpan-like 7 [Homarus americanus]